MKVKDPTQEPSLGLVLILILTALAVFGHPDRETAPHMQRSRFIVCVNVEISNKRSPRSVSKMLRVKIHSVA